MVRKNSVWVRILILTVSIVFVGLFSIMSLAMADEFDPERDLPPIPDLDWDYDEFDDFENDLSIRPWSRPYNTDDWEVLGNRQSDIVYSGNLSQKFSGNGYLAMHFAARGPMIGVVDGWFYDPMGDSGHFAIVWWEPVIQVNRNHSATHYRVGSRSGEYIVSDVERRKGWSYFRIQVLDDGLKIYINDQLAFEDPDITFSDGEHMRIGNPWSNGTTFYIDNVRVRYKYVQIDNPFE